MKPASKSPRPGSVSGSASGRTVSTETPEQEVSHEVAAEFSTEELLEFLEADQLPVSADPVFREGLREDLWRMLQQMRRARRD